MQQLTTFFYSFVNSISNPKYYADVLKAKAWFSWKYFLFWNLLVSLVVLVYVVPPIARFQPEQVTDQIITAYPAELEISGTADGIEINQERPYSIPFPAEWTEQIPEEAKEDIDVNDIPLDQAENFSIVTFDTDENIQNIQDFYQSQSLAVLTETTIYVLDDADTGEVRVYQMPTFDEEFSFGLSEIESTEQKILNHPFVAQKWYVPLLGLFMVIIMIPLTIWWRIITIAVYSVIVWIAAGFFLKQLKLSYGKAFQVGLHSLTLPVLIKIIADGVVTYSNVSFDFSGIWFFAVYMIWTLYGLSQVRTISTKSTPKKKAKKRTTKKK